MNRKKRELRDEKIKSEYQKLLNEGNRLQEAKEEVAKKFGLSVQHIRNILNK